MTIWEKLAATLAVLLTASAPFLVALRNFLGRRRAARALLEEEAAASASERATPIPVRLAKVEQQQAEAHAQLSRITEDIGRMKRRGSSPDDTIPPVTTRWRP